MSRSTWNRTKQQRLFAELKGFWSEDTWDMHHSPVRTGLSPIARQRYLYFDCKTPAVNGELKYACWKKFSSGHWRTTAETCKVHRLIKWLNTLNPPPASLMSRSFETWREEYRKYLKSRAMYSPGTTTRMDREQRPRMSPRDSAYVGTLRQVHLVLKNAYDDRPEHEKDVWDLQQLSVPVNLSLSNTTLNFHLIRQLWLRKAVKAYLRYCLPIYAEGTCRIRLQSLTRFSEFLAEKRPNATAKTITRNLLVEYLSYLVKRIGIAVRKNDVINVRTFLEISACERWLPIGSKRMIYDEEVPQPPKPQPRYIPSAVLDELNRNASIAFDLP
jgi:hypothetical protein